MCRRVHYSFAGPILPCPARAMDRVGLDRRPKLWAGLGELHSLAEPTLEELASASFFGGPCRPVATVLGQESRPQERVTTPPGEAVQTVRGENKKQRVPRRNAYSWRHSEVEVKRKVLEQCRAEDHREHFCRHTRTLSTTFSALGACPMGGQVVQVATENILSFRFVFFFLTA